MTKPFSVNMVLIILILLKIYIISKYLDIFNLKMSFNFLKFIFRKTIHA